MILLILEIVIVCAAFAALLASLAKLGKNAMSFGRTAKRAQANMAPRVGHITAQADTTRELGFRVMDRAEELEQKGAALSLTMNKMRVIAEAASEAKKSFDRITGYVGL